MQVRTLPDMAVFNDEVERFIGRHHEDRRLACVSLQALRHALDTAVNAILTQASFGEPSAAVVVRKDAGWLSVYMERAFTPPRRRGILPWRPPLGEVVVKVHFDGRVELMPDTTATPGGMSDR